MHDGAHQMQGRAIVKAIICTFLAGNFLLGAVALHAYMTPVIAGDGQEVYIVKNGQIYIAYWPYGLDVYDESDHKLQNVVKGVPATPTASSSSTEQP
jgi:hypothetical protein